LQTASGSEFDRLFVAAQIQGHREALTVYTAIQQSGAAPASDRAIALLAADRIREHLTLLEALSSRA
jgi:predicted outer membrane protein